MVSAEENVYEWKEGCEILVVMFDVKRVVNAVPLWAGNDRRQGSQAQPDIRVVDESPKPEHQEKDDEVRRLRPEDNQDWKIKNNE